MQKKNLILSYFLILVMGCGQSFLCGVNITNCLKFGKCVMVGYEK